MIYLIGGAPRVGKSILYRQFAARLRMGWISTNLLGALLRAGQEAGAKTEWNAGWHALPYQDILSAYSNKVSFSRVSKESTMGKKDSSSKSPKKSGGLPGWPGYRTREGRSGYDPIDTRTEAAHTAGTIVQRLFTGQFRNPFHVLLLGVVGLILTLPLVLGILEAVSGNWLPWNAWIFLLPTGIAGILILINFIRNLIRRRAR